MNFLNSIEGLLPKNRLARSVIGLASGTALGQAMVIFASPILTRLYTPADFGVLSLYVAVIAIVGVVAGLRYEFALPIASSNHDAAALAVLGCGLTLLTSLLAWIALLLAWGPIEDAFDLALLRPYRWMVPVGIASIGIFNTFTFWGTREQMYGVLARSKLSQGVGIVATQVGAGLMTAGGIGLIAGDVIGRIIGALYIGRRVGIDHFRHIRSLDSVALKSVLVRFQRFPLLSAPASFFNTLGLRLPVILVAGLYGIEPAGWLMLSQMTIGGPMTLIGQSVSRVYTGELGRQRRESPSLMENLFLRMTVKLARYCFLPILVLAVVAPMVFEWVFGENWYTAGLYTRLLAMMLIAQIIVVPVASTLTILERQDLQLIWNVLRVFVVVLGFWFAAYNGLSDYFAIAIYCGLMFFFYAALWCISFFQIRQYLLTEGNEP